MTHRVQGCPPGADPVTLGGIFGHLGHGFLSNTPLNERQRQAFRAIATCRTAVLGGAVWRCGACGHRVGIYHSCRDRHCPRCQAQARAQWVKARLAEVLPVPYFHTVFTLPHALNPLIRANRRAAISCLFRAVTATLKTFAANPRHLGAEPGILLVLHTWGRQLNFHVHIHGIVTGGGLNHDRTAWVPAANRNFLFPVRAMSSVFRGKYLDGLEALVGQGKIVAGPGRVLNQATWQRLRQRLVGCQWVVYAKRPFGGPAQVIKYLGAYTHRVGIANNRLRAFDGERVTFCYKDHRDETSKCLSLPVGDFVRRFLDHVLPRGLMRIRYAGFLASCKKAASLEACRRVLGVATITRLPESEPEAEDRVMEKVAIVRPCPACGALMLSVAAPPDKAEARALYRQIYGPSRGPP